ncbi:DUF5009 domain-containing protein [Pedobacter sp. HMF7647]|uniref:DUF5009 domain-containing protein n=1 Tax=Hufsiella arboris TaxID=2695275 RepID=A0A7K1Y4N7_9SPHI|nr:DUF5009 domain-containing protein [Hufsiella arboris]MXV49534.1 DUF5009 domain-containing protein [Hufsiella arboris]
MSQPSIVQSHRLLSLDVFRGITVAAMILVNNPGDWGHIYAPLEHAEWNGCTPTDLIFPFFLFIVGVSIAYALGTKKEKNEPQGKILFTAFKRGLILFGLGVFLSLYPKVFTEPVEAFKHVRIPGVLQRIGVVFFICAVLFMKTSSRTQIRIFWGILIFYWAMILFVPAPGAGYPNMEKETSIGAWIDRTLLGENHLWSSSRTWDPEGIFSTIPAISTGLFGVLVGTFLRRKDKAAAEKVAWLFTVGAAAVILGLLWDLEFPINKAMWTSSYVLYAGGLASIALAFSYWLIDIQGYNRWTKPFVAYGVNAITVFVLSAVIVKTLWLIKIGPAGPGQLNAQSWMYAHFFAPNFSPINASLAWAIFFVLFWLLILWWMLKKKIIIKI